MACAHSCGIFDFQHIDRHFTIYVPSTMILYPAAEIWQDLLYVVDSINKEDVGATRITLCSLSGIGDILL